MSTQAPTVPKYRSHRQTRSAALPTSVTPPQNPQNPHHLDQYAQVSDTVCETEQAQHPTTPPRTPQKSNHNLPATTQKNQLSGSEGIPNPKSRKKGARNFVNSPVASRNDRSTPPLTAVQSAISSSLGQVSTPSATAYAGPTFHASPAPSTLPIPSFFSKSVPDSPSIKELQSGREESSSGGDESPTPPVAKPVLPQPQREESPLDFFFKADREEKARARSASSFHASRTESGPFPPPHGSPRTSHNTPPPPENEGQSRPPHFSGGHTSALFAMELDGTSSPGKPYGPAFSTPYNQRISAARSPSAQIEPTTQLGQQQSKTTDMSEALKAFLFSPTPQNPPVTRPFGPPEATLTPACQSDPAIRSVPNSSISQRGNGNLPWLQQNNLHHLNNSGASRHPPRAGSRSSGLRQEFMATNVSAPAPEQAGLSDLVPPSFFQSPKHDQHTKSTNLPKTSSSLLPPPLQVSVSPSGMQSGSQPSEFKQMEESLRRILKIGPVGSSGA